MNKRLMMLMAFVAVFVSSTLAQNDGKRGKGRREDFSEMQLKQVIKALKLDNDKTAEFTALYQEYQQALKDCNQPLEAGKKVSEMTDEELDQKIKNDFEQGRKMLEVKETYYDKFKGLLTVQQINTMYNVERMNMNLLNDERMNRRNDNSRRRMPERDAFGGGDDMMMD